jgi:uncharacterized membrane protein
MRLFDPHLSDEDPFRSASSRSSLLGDQRDGNEVGPFGFWTDPSTAARALDGGRGASGGPRRRARQGEPDAAARLHVSGPARPGHPFLADLGRSHLLVSSPGSGDFRFGDLLFLAATIPLGLSVTVVRRIAPTTPSLEMARYQMICAAAMVAPCALVGVLVLGETAPGLSDPGAWGPAVYAGLVGLALSNVSFNYAMGRISAIVAGIALNLVPVVGFISATLLLGEEMSVVQLIGALLIVVGLGISAFSTRAIEASAPLSIEGYLHGNRPVDSRE